MSEKTCKDIIVPFYEALNQPSQKDVRSLIESVASPDWASYSANEVSKGREAFIQQVMGFGKLLPDLAWRVEEVLSDGNRIVVRSEASGTPAADFMGVPVSGRRFAIMAIDVHTVEAGKLVRAYHVEDWAGAIRQLRG